MQSNKRSLEKEAERLEELANKLESFRSLAFIATAICFSASILFFSGALFILAFICVAAGFLMHYLTRHFEHKAHSLLMRHFDACARHISDQNKKKVKETQYDFY